MTDLSKLHERVCAATGPDRELDGDLWRALVGFDPDMLPKVWPDIGSAPVPWPSLTGSLDAVIALVERKLPECVWELTRDMNEAFSRAELGKRVGDQINVFRARAATPILALLAALLSTHP